MPYLHSETEPFALRKADWKNDVLASFFAKQANVSDDPHVENLVHIACLIEDTMIASKYDQKSASPYLATGQAIEESGMVFDHRHIVPIVEYCAAFILEERMKNPRSNDKSFQTKALYAMSYNLRKKDAMRHAALFSVYDQIDAIFEARTWKEASVGLLALDAKMQKENIEMQAAGLDTLFTSSFIRIETEVRRNAPPSLYLRSQLLPFKDADRKSDGKELRQFIERGKNRDKHNVNSGFEDLCDDIERIMEIVGQKGNLRHFDQINDGFNAFTGWAPRTMKVRDFIVLSEYCAMHVLRKKYEEKINFSFSYQKQLLPFFAKRLDPQEYDRKKQVERHMEELMNAPNWEGASDALHDIEAVFRSENTRLTAKEARDFLLPCFCHYAALNYA